MQPLCFVLMPFGRKRDPAGAPDIDFDRVYVEAIAPAIADAGLDAVRADREVTGGIIHKAMFERLLLCDFAVADLTTANANVFYELGVRHATRPHTTVVIYAEGQPIPFDVALVRALPYRLGAGNAFPEAERDALRQTLRARLEDARRLAAAGPAVDSPLVQLLAGYDPPAVAHLKTDVFRDRVSYAESTRQALRHARALKSAAGREAVAAIDASLGPLDAVEAGVLVDLLLSYRAVGANDATIALYERLPAVLQRTVLVREQLAFALNRQASADPAAREELRARAVDLLEALVAERGPSSETCGLLGRIHKDRWKETRAGEPSAARGHLRRAIDTYRRGFEADVRDAFPGVNAVTLLDVEGSAESLAERDRLVPVVRYAAEQHARAKRADYWDHATLLELAVVAGDRAAAAIHLGDALAALREPWEAETTADNLGMIAEARVGRGEDARWLEAIVAELMQAFARRRG